MAADRKVKGWKESDFAYTISLFELFSPLDRGQWGSPQHITLLCVSVRWKLDFIDKNETWGAERILCPFSGFSFLEGGLGV